MLLIMKQYNVVEAYTARYAKQYNQYLRQA